MPNVIFSTGVVIFAVMNTALTTGPSAAPTLESIRAAQEARSGAIKTLVIEERVVTRRQNSEWHEDHVFSRMQDRVERAEQRAWENVACEPTTVEEMLELEQRVRAAGDEGFPEEILSVLIANRMTLTQDHSVYDFPASRYRLRHTDLRDLRNLADEHSLPDRQFGNLTATKTLVGGPSYSILLNHDATVATLLSGGSRPITERLELLGIAPTRLLTWKSPCTVESNGQGRIVVRGLRMESEGIAFELTLENRPGYPMSRLVRYGPAGEIHEELSLSDFRAAEGGTMVPYRSVQTRRMGDAGGAVQSVVRDVVNLQINKPVSAEAFVVPSTARLTALEADAVSAYKADQAILRP